MIILGIGYLIYYLFTNLTIVNYKEKRVLIDKQVTFNFSGQSVYYHLKWRLPDGSTIVESRNFNTKNTYEIGKTYLVDKQKIKFK